MRTRRVRRWIAAGLLTGAAVLVTVPAAPVRADEDGAEEPAPEPAEQGAYAGQPTSFWIAELRNKETRHIARSVLLHIGDPAMPPLIEAMLAAEEGEAAFLADVLLKAKPSDEMRRRMIPRIVQAATHAQGIVRRTSAHWLGHAGPASRDHVDLLVRLAGDKYSKAAASAIWALGRAGVANDTTLGVLRSRLKEKSFRGTAIIALRDIGKAAAPATDDLVRSFYEVSTRGRSQVLEALFAVAPDDPRPILLLKAEAVSKDVKRRRSAAWWLEKRIRAGTDVSEPLAALLADTDARVVQTAAKALRAKPDLSKPYLAEIAEALGSCPAGAISEMLQLVTAVDSGDPAITRALVGRWAELPQHRNLKNEVTKRSASAAALLVEELVNGGDRAVAAARLITKLRDGALERRADAIRAFVENDASPFEGRAALFPRCIAVEKPWRGGPLLGSWLVSPDERQRTLARELAPTARADAAKVVVAALGSSDVAVRRAAIDLAPSYGHFPGFEEALAACMDHADAELAKAAYVAFMKRLEDRRVSDIARYGPRLIPGWRDALASKDPVERLRGLRGLVTLEHHADPVRADIIAALDDPDDRCAQAATDVLAHLVAGDPEGVRADLEPVLSEGTAAARAGALVALRRSGRAPQDEEARIRALAGLPDARVGLLRLMRHIPRTADWTSPLTDLWVRLCDHEDPWVARQAVQVLARTDPLRDEGWAALERIVRDERHPATGTAFRHLPVLAERGVPLIVAALGSDDFERRRDAIQYIGKMKDVDVEVRTRIFDIAADVKDPHRDVARRVVLAWEKNR